MSVLIGCLVIHALLALVIASPWWIPDVTLAGLVLSVGKTPEQWLRCSVTAGLFTMCWAARFPAQVFLGYVACGMMIRLAAIRWDTTDLRLQWLLAVGAGSGMTLALMWLETLWSLPVLGLASGHVALTGLCVPLLRRLLRRHGAAQQVSSAIMRRGGGI